MGDELGIVWLHKPIANYAILPPPTVAGVGGRRNALDLREIAVEAGDGVEPTALRHVGHRDAFAHGGAIDDAAGFGDAVVIDEVVEGLALSIDVDRDVGLVSADGSGQVGERETRVEVDLVALHASLQRGGDEGIEHLLRGFAFFCRWCGRSGGWLKCRFG